MFTLLLTISAIISVLLMAIVLMQASKGDGLSGTFGGGAGANMGAMFGTRRTADFLSKATWWLGGGLAILAILMNLFFLPGVNNASQKESIIQQSSNQQIPQTPTLPQQQVPAQQQQSQPKK